MHLSVEPELLAVYWFLSITKASDSHYKILISKVSLHATKFGFLSLKQTFCLFYLDTEYESPEEGGEGPDEGGSGSQLDFY